MPTVQRLYKHINDPLPLIEGLNDNVQDDINKIIEKATAKNPKDRFQDVTEMAAAFRVAANTKNDPTISAESLTPREEDVLERIVDGMTNQEIAQDLFIEITTVKWYITQIYRKIGVRSRKQAIDKVQEARLFAEGGSEENVVASASDEYADVVNPYKGLRPFDVSDARDYYGREELVEKLINCLARLPSTFRPRLDKLSPGEGRFLAIVGPSGSGKSSLVQAGLIPALRRGSIPGSEHWFIVQLIPGSRPLDQLEIALSRVAANQSENLRHHLERDGFGLLRVAELVLPQNDSELLVVIDQIEELFTSVEDRATRAHFLSLLAKAVLDPKSRVRVILTLRADYYDRPLHFPEFGQLLRNNMETILPLSSAGLERAILRPADRIGVGFEPGLVDTIIEDVQYQPGALPLLQYALTELFEERDGGLLSHAAYQSIGGTTGALARRAEELYQEQDREGQEAIRQLMLRLVVLNDESTTADTRQRVPRSELSEIVDNDDLIEELIDTYTAYRLLTLSHDPKSRTPTIEVAHEALLREWQRLAGWLEEGRDDLRIRYQLGRATEEWQQAGADPSFLLRGTRLKQFETWRKNTRLALTQPEIEYLQVSQEVESERQVHQAEQARYQRNLRQALIIALSLGFVFAIGLSIFAFGRQRAAEASEQEALRQASIGLAAQAVAELNSEEPDRGVLLALAALTEYPYTTQAERALAQTIYRTHRYSKFQSVPDQVISSIEFSPDGTLIAGGGQMAIWDANSGEIISELNSEIVSIGSGSFDWLSDNSGLLVSWEGRDWISFLDVATKEERLHHVIQDGWVINTVYVSEDDRLALSADNHGFAGIWRIETGEVVQSFFHGSAVNDAVWSPDERQVATGTRNGHIRIWDAETGIQLERYEAHKRGVTALSWSSEGTRLASSGYDGLVRIWDASTGDLLLNLIGHNGVVRDIEWSPDGSLLATAGNDDLVRIWEPLAGIQLITFPAFGADVTDISWSPDGQRLVVGGGSAPRVWDVETPIVRLVGYSKDEAGFIQTNDPYWSHDSTWVGAGGNDDTYRLWDSSTGEIIDTFRNVNQGRGQPNQDGTKIFISSPPRIINLETGETQFVAQAGFFPVEWSPDGTLLTAWYGSPTYGYPIYDAETLELLYFGEHGRCRINFPGVFSPDNIHLAIACPPGDTTSVLIIEALTGEVVKELSGHTESTHAARWSPDGTKVASTSADLTVRIWDVDTGETETIFTGHTANPIDVDWSPDGSRLVSGDAVGNVLVWEAATGAVVNRYNVGGYTFGIRWSPDGTRVLTTGVFNAPDIRPVWQSAAELIEYTYSCCVFRELTADEREQFGLPISDG